MWRSLLFVLGVVLGLSVSAPASATDLAAFAAKAKRSVVHLDVLDARGQKVGSGTGFFVTEGGRIVTNHHVIDGAGAMTATLFDGRTVPVLGVLRADEANDVAVILAAPGRYEPLVLGSSQAAKAGDDVAVIGSPIGLAGTLSVGIVSAVRADGPKLEAADGARFNPSAWTIQITAPISPGSSGSPVLETAKSTVIAVAVGQHSEGQALNFAVPIEHARDLLAGLGPNAEVQPFARQPAAPRLLLNLLISAAFFGGLLLAWWGLGRLWRPRRP